MWEKILDAINEKNIDKAANLIILLNDNEIYKEEINNSNIQKATILAVECGLEEIVIQLLNVWGSKIINKEINNLLTILISNKFEKAAAILISQIKVLSLEDIELPIINIKFAHTMGYREIEEKIFFHLREEASNFLSLHDNFHSLHDNIFLTICIVNQMEELGLKLISLMKDKDFNKRNIQNDTLLTIALTNGCEKIALELIKRMDKETICSITTEGKTSLILAIEHSFEKIAEKLIPLMPIEILNHFDKNNLTALSWALNKKLDNITHILADIMQEDLNNKQNIPVPLFNSAENLHELTKQKLSSFQIKQIKTITELLEDKNPWYSDTKIEELLKLELKDDKIINAPIIILEHKELLTQIIQQAVKDSLNNKVVVVPIHIHNNHWAGIVIKKLPDGGLQVIYNNSKGEPLVLEKNSGALFKAINKISGEFTFIDLCKKQQYNDDDCGPFLIDNLVTLARVSTEYMHKTSLAQLLFTSINGRADELRSRQNEILKKEINSLSSEQNSEEMNEISTTYNNIEVNINPNYFSGSHYTDLLGEE